MYIKLLEGVSGKRQQPARAAKQSLSSGIKPATNKILPKIHNNGGKKKTSDKIKVFKMNI